MGERKREEIAVLSRGRYIRNTADIPTLNAISYIFKNLFLHKEI